MGRMSGEIVPEDQGTSPDESEGWDVLLGLFFGEALNNGFDGLDLLPGDELGDFMYLFDLRRSWAIMLWVLLLYRLLLLVLLLVGFNLAKTDIRALFLVLDFDADLDPDSISNDPLLASVMGKTQALINTMTYW